MASESAWLSEIRSCRITSDQIRWANRGQTAAPKADRLTRPADEPTTPVIRSCPTGHGHINGIPPTARAQVTSTFRFFACASVTRVRYEIIGGRNPPGECSITSRSQVISQILGKGKGSVGTGANVLRLQHGQPNSPQRRHKNPRSCVVLEERPT